MNALQVGPLPALARLLMSAIFIQAGFGKLMAPGMVIGYIGAHGLPVPMAAYVVAVIVELGGGIAILVGWQTRIISVALVLFCLVTAAAFHYVPGDQNMMNHFMKNISMAGGFLLLTAFGAGAWSVDARLARYAKGTQPA
jgi:putative oxidoreductase